MYVICILVLGCTIAASLMVLGSVYHPTSLFLYGDVLCIVGMLASFCFGNIVQAMQRVYRRRDTFAFRQPRSTASPFKKAREYAFYLLAYGCTLWILFASTTTLEGGVGISVLFFLVGSIYMLLIRPSLAKWIIWMVIAPWHTLIRREQPPVSTTTLWHPTVSVIIPAWNEEVGIIGTMKSVLTSHYSPLELIVVNDGSTDATERKVQTFIAEHGHEYPGKTITYLYQPNAGKSAALNTGIRRVHSEVVVIIDADCVVHPYCITRLVEPFADPEVMGSTGNYRVGNVHSLLGRVQAMEYAIGFYTRKTDTLFGTVFVLSGTGSAFRNEVFDRIGYFHTRNITEDLEMTMRMHKAGMKIVSVSQAILCTETPVTLQGLFKQRLRWVRGTLDAFSEHSDVLFSRKKQRGKIHSWIVLPLIRLNHFSVLVQQILKYSILIMCIATHQYASFAVGQLLISVIAGISILSDADYRETVLLAPIAWILLDIPNGIYATAFLVGWWNYLNKKQQSWQRWKRQGITNV